MESVETHKKKRKKEMEDGGGVSGRGQTDEFPLYTYILVSFI